MNIFLGANIFFADIDPNTGQSEPKNFNDCIKNSWKQFSIKTNSETKVIKCDQFPYESIDSGLFYDKINTRCR